MKGETRKSAHLFKSSMDWLSPTQKTRPPWLRHTRAPRGCAAAPQKVKEQREARSRCTVVRTRAAGPRPQRAHSKGNPLLEPQISRRPKKSSSLQIEKETETKKK